MILFLKHITTIERLKSRAIKGRLFKILTWEGKINDEKSKSAACTSPAV